MKEEISREVRLKKIQELFKSIYGEMIDLEYKMLDENTIAFVGQSVIDLFKTKYDCEKIAGEWNGDEDGRKAERAEGANEILGKIEQIEKLLRGK